LPTSGSDGSPQRKRQAGRCEGCGLHHVLCLCARFPEVEVRTPLVVVQHIRERFKPTNTGRLLHKMVKGSGRTEFGMREPPFDTTPLQRPDVQWHVLFPREDATELTVPRVAQMRAELPAGHQLGFVLLDGTWHQCSRMSRRVPVVDTLPCVSLPPGPPSRWGVRTQHDVRGLSTFEAGLRLLAVTESEAVARTLRTIFFELAARLQYMKGSLRRPEVPAEWNYDPLLGSPDDLRP
jgi:DTW domain-containing protein YfiP